MSGFSNRPPQGFRHGDNRGRDSTGRQEQSHYRSEPAFDSFWADYLQGGYFDDKGNLRAELVERSRVEPFAKALGDAKLTTHQLRRFFGHCRRIETRLKSGGESWDSLAADFFKLDIAAADASGKAQAKIPRLFHDFIKRNVAAVKSQKDFLQGFLPHFEALVGFASGKLSDRN